MNKIIALDIGRVCYHIDDSKIRKELGIDYNDKRYSELYSLGTKLETGKIINSDFFTEFNRITNRQYSELKILNLWNTIIAEPLEGMLDIIKEISDLGFRFIFFSDTSEIHKDYIFKNNSFSKYVDGGIYSYEVGAQKPSDKMYQAFEKEYGKPCFYIDDKLENIQGGLKNDWNSFQFTKQNLFYDKFMSVFK